MSGLLAPAGWLAAAGSLAALVALARERARRLELVARAAHELAGPLTAARLGLHTLTRAAAPAPLLGAIDLELRRAGLALDDLAAARSGRRAPDRVEPVGVRGLALELVVAWRPVARAAGRELTLEGPPADVAVRGDRLRLAQAIGNLLANSIEHGGGQIRLRVRASGGRVRIEVADDGPGLSAPIGRLARGRRGGRGARGRGMAIAAAIAADHGGRIAAAPAARGARVAIELPVLRSVT